MASTIPNPFLTAAEEALRDITATRYTLAAALVVLFYDWVLSLGSEIKLIWPARRSVVKTIYLVNRYCLPIVMIWANYAWSGQALWFKPLSCRVFLVLDSCLIIAFFASLHYIVSLRAWALYGRSRAVGFLLWGGFTLYLAAAYTLTIKGLLSIPASLFPIVDICFGTLPSYLWAIWLPSILFETLVFALTLFKAVQHQKSNLSHTPILSTLYRDGFLYFLFICLNSACNLLFWAIASPTKVLLVKYLSTAVTLAAGSHLILDLREVGHHTGQSVDSTRGEPLTPLSPGGNTARGYTTLENRRMSAFPGSGISPGEHIRLVSPWEWQDRLLEERHLYPPSPQSYYPPSPTAIRFAVS